MKVVINRCYGGFGLSDAAYEKLIEWGVPVRKYVKEGRVNGRYVTPPENEGEIIFDRELTPLGEDEHNDKFYYAYKDDGSLFGRYWETWIGRGSRAHPLIVRVVEELGSEVASSKLAALAIVEIPDGTDYEIDEYDGIEHIAEAHRTWA